MKKCIFKMILFILVFVSIISINELHAEELTNIEKIEPTTICTFKYKSIYYEDVGIITTPPEDNLAMQGAYFFEKDGKVYAIYAGTYGAKTADADKKENDLPNVMTLVDLTSKKVVAKAVSKDIMGHANDITYDKENDKFYVSGAKALYGFKIYTENIGTNKDVIVWDSAPTGTSFSTGAMGYDSFERKLYYISRKKNLCCKN